MRLRRVFGVTVYRHDFLNWLLTVVVVLAFGLVSIACQSRLLDVQTSASGQRKTDEQRYGVTLGYIDLAANAGGQRTALPRRARVRNLGHFLRWR